MKREFGVDMLKIVAMLFIVADHIVSWGGWGLCSGQGGLKGSILSIYNAFCLCAVNCFILASGWIMCRKDFKLIRIVSLWLEVEFYTILVLLVACAFFPDVEISKRDWLFCMLPIALNRYWFFTQYVALFFMMPILNSAIRTLDRRLMFVIIFAGFLMFSFHPFFFKNDMLHVNRGYSLVWFVYLYLCGGAAYYHSVLPKIPTWLTCLGIAVGGIGSFCALQFVVWASPLLGITSNPALFDAYNSPFLFLGSLAMLALFTRLQFAKSIEKVIAIIAPSVFSVYIIHSHHFFRVMTNWNENWSTFLDGNNTMTCLVGVTAFSVFIFGSCIVVDFARRKIKSALSCAVSSLSNETVSQIR